MIRSVANQGDGRWGRFAQLLRPWPLLIAAVAAMLGSVLLVESSADREVIAAALLAISAVCVGAWIALLANAGYTGHDDPDPLPPVRDDEDDTVI